MENQNFVVTKSDKFMNLSEPEKLKYKLFLTSILKLGRETTKIKKINPTINEIELPHLIINDKNSESITITYSIDKKCWLTKTFHFSFALKFNPTAISGVIEFLKDYDIEDINISIGLFDDELKSLYEKYKIT